MSENLKRAELLFNRIMNQNKPDPKNHRANTPHHRHSYKQHKNHPHPAPVPAIDLPKRDAVQEAADAVAALVGDQHVLPYCWTVWFHLRTKNKAVVDEDKPAAAAVESYLQTTQEIAFPQYGGDGVVQSIASLEQMWLAMTQLKKPHELATGCELLVFKTGVRPVWEDPVNARGGRWVFRFSHRLGVGETHDTVRQVRRRTTLVWERLLLRTLGGAFVTDKGASRGTQLNADIAGLVLSVRRDEDIVLVWNSNIAGRGDDDKRRLTPFQARRVICDTVLRIIRECDVILQGSDCVDTAAKPLTERVAGVTFEYRLHLDSSSSYVPSERRRKFHHHHRDDEREEKVERLDERDEAVAA